MVEASSRIQLPLALADLSGGGDILCAFAARLAVPPDWEILAS